MFQSPTVIVLGAGSSKEVGLPTGAELNNLIAAKCSVNAGRYDAFDPMHIALAQLLGGERNDFNAAVTTCWAIRDAMRLSNSIDQFLDSRQSDEKIIAAGKLAIASSIIDAEKSSRLFFEYRGGDEVNRTMNNTINTWFNVFFKMLNEGVKIENAHQCLSNITVINFNYDRCLEHFLQLAFHKYYTISLADAGLVADRLKVLRPYGKICRLPHQQSNGPSRSFGESAVRGLENLSDGIRTFTEQVEEPVSREIRQAISCARNIVFLGFGFHRLNMQLLTPDKPAKARIFATANGLSRSDVGQILSDLSYLSQPDRDPVLDPSQCFDFLRANKRALLS